MSERTSIHFQELNYMVEEEIFQKPTKQILKNVNGDFKSSQLSAIIGPSGSGKTSLLSILSGYVTKNVSGVIDVSDIQSRAYIMQEENLHPILTVSESMRFSINLKTGSSMKKCEKKQKIQSILGNLGLDDKCDVFVRDLSGGQRKRLSIAIELVSDPMILFLDEPTTGLDYSSSNQCIRLLKKLAQQGKTIICTIHTPSALVLKICDQLYALADGVCIYQGSSGNLVSFLQENDLICPRTYNPCDFLMEIATGEYGSLNEKLSGKIENGLNESYQQAKNKMIQNVSSNELTEANKNFSSSFCAQVCNLMHRNFLILYRDLTILWLRLAIHIILPIFVGIFFFNAGSEASKIYANFKLVYAIGLFLLYTGFYSMVIRFALDLPFVRRENFNRWYTPSSYYIAISLADIPLTFFCAFICVSIIYVLSGQLIEEFRFFTFLSIQVLLTFGAQGMGMLIGSIFKLMGTLFFAATTLPLIILFGGFLVTRNDANIMLQWVFDINFVKNTGDASMSTLLGYNRSKLVCEEAFYCHFQRPHKFLEFIGVEDEITYFSIATILIYLIGLRLAAFIVMNYRLRH